MLKRWPKKSNGDGLPLNIDGKTFKDSQSIANTFSTYFTNATENMSVNNSMTMNSALNYLYQVFTRPFSHIKLTPVSTKEISKIIKSLKWKNSHGYDEIPTKILKISLPFIISPLTYICNKSLSNGIFPTWLKYSQINPIFKKGNKTEMSNYIPISLLTSFSKVFEKVIYKRLHYHIKNNNILAKEQYGFRNN